MSRAKRHLRRVDERGPRPARRAAGPEPPPGWLVVAEIGPAHGLRGEVTARLADVDAETLLAVEGLRLLRPDGSEGPATLRRVRAKKAGAILDLAELADRTAAEACRGAVLVASRESLPEPADDEWWIADLVGLAVETEDGEALGTLVEVLRLPANDVFVVRGARGEILLPVIDEVVREVDSAAGRVTVHLLPGLLDDGPGAGTERPGRDDGRDDG